MKDHSFKTEALTFLKGFWEIPTEKPNLVYAFLRGAILAAVLSIIFPTESTLELVLWVGLLGLVWTATDVVIWRYVSKKKGAK